MKRLLFSLLFLPVVLFGHEKSQWKGHLKGGVSTKGGNSSVTDVHGDLYGEREEYKGDHLDEVLTLHGHGLFSKTDGKVAKNEFFALAKYKKFFREEWFWYVGQRLDHDEVKDLSIASHSNGGVGYWAIREERESLFLSVGLGFQYKRYENHFDRGSGTLTNEIAYSKGFGKDFVFGSATESIVPLSAPREFSVRQEFTVKLPFDESWGVETGLYLNYENRPATGKKSLDRQIRASLAYYF